MQARAQRWASSSLSSSPLRCRLCFHLCHGRLLLVRTLLIQHKRKLHVEQVISPPLELDRVFLSVFVFTVDGDIDVPELLGDEGLDAVVLVDDKAEGRELARTCLERSACKSYVGAEVWSHIP